MAEDSHVASRIAEALARCGGDRKAAQRLVLNWCGSDVRLLHGLVRPFLGGIVAQAVEHAEASAVTARRALTARGLDTVIGQLGRTIGTAAPTPRGMSALVDPPPAPVKAGPRHEQTMRQLAALYAHRRRDRQP